MMTPFEHHDVHARVRKRKRFHLALNRLDVVQARLLGCRNGAFEHLGQEVECEDAPRRTASPRREDRVDPPAAAEIEDGVSRRDPRVAKVVSHAERVLEGELRHARQLLRRVELLNGGRVWACGACTGPRGISADDLVDGAAIVTAANLAEVLVAGAATVAF